MAEPLKTQAPGESQEQPFRRHKFLSYQGYAFPWYVTLYWITFFVGGLVYFVYNVLLN